LKVNKMIESEVLDIIKGKRRLGLLADEFRGGRDIRDLMVLLSSDNDQIVEIGAWIAGEIKIDPANAQPLITRLRQLVSHENPSIRSQAIGALFPFHDWTDPATKETLVKLSRDPNKGVRLTAQATLKRMPQK